LTGVVDVHVLVAVDVDGFYKIGFETISGDPSSHEAAFSES